MKKKIVIGLLVIFALAVAYLFGRISSIGNRNQINSEESSENASVISKQSVEQDADSITVADGMVENEPAQKTVTSESQSDELRKEEIGSETAEDRTEFDKSIIPPYSGNPFEEVNNGKPFFLNSINIDSSFDTSAEEFVYYSELDTLGRCGQAYANVCSANLPTEPREEIGSIKPSGWQTVKYPDVIEDLYLYNRCHLIGYQLGGGSANERNLITGTRYMNVEGMLPFENRIKEYVLQTQNHVLYRVTPVFDGDNLVADGVLMEAYSAEDNGEGICFCAYAYNVQPGIEINYVTGDSRALTPDELSQTNFDKGAGEEIGDKTNLVSESEESSNSGAEAEHTTENSDKVKSDRTDYNFDTYDNEEQQETTDQWVLNTKSHRIHKPSCDSVPKIAPNNYDTSNESIEELEAKGYKRCGNCLK